VQTTRIHNFSLFVTVLSACLGLLAVGTPAQIYAQPAPRSAEASSSSGEGGTCEETFAGLEELLNLDALFNPSREFVADLGRLASIGKYEFGNSGHVDISLNIPQTRGGITWDTSSSGNRWLHVAAVDAAEKIVFVFADPHIFYRNDGVSEVGIAHVKIAFHLDSYGLTITTTQEQQSNAEAQKFAANYNASFAYEACRAKDAFAQSFYQNTTARVEGNKILIVTRLPRAALENPQAEQPAAN
jgi:hypothetical protein